MTCIWCCVISSFWLFSCLARAVVDADLTRNLLSFVSPLLLLVLHPFLVDVLCGSHLICVAAPVWLPVVQLSVYTIQ